MPTTLISNWQDEAARFTPGLRVLTLQGPQRAALFDAIPNYDLVLTTYPLVSRDIEALKKHRYALVIADESQSVKNHTAQAATALRNLKADRFLLVTGTPVENNLGDLFSLVDLALPTLLGDARHFRRAYRTPIEKRSDPERLARMNSRIKPFILRRQKNDVERDLPPKTEILQLIDLGEKQRELYESIRVAQHQKVKDAIAARGVAQSGIIVLTALLKLRQVCCDPSILPAVHNVRVQDSAKLDALMERLDSLISENRRVLVFSQFVTMLDVIAQKLVARRVEHVMLTGQSEDRASLIRRFQTGDVPVFLISLKAGGVGLNLTAADTVIHYDPWFNPAVENQATDRAHRIGQDKPVFVYKLIAKDTVEERVLALQKTKADLASAVLDGGTTTTVQFDEQTIEALLGAGGSEENIDRKPARSATG